MTKREFNKFIEDIFKELIKQELEDKKK